MGWFEAVQGNHTRIAVTAERSHRTEGYNKRCGPFQWTKGPEKLREPDEADITNLTVHIDHDTALLLRKIRARQGSRCRICLMKRAFQTRGYAAFF
jgi:hypothetical protein